MGLNIVKPSDLRKSFLKILIYGRSGVGKTNFSTSSFNRIKENKLKTLVLDLESGTSAIPRNDIDIVRITEPMQFKETLEYLKNNETDYDLIVISSWTKYSEMLYIAAKEIAKQEEEETGKKNQFRVWGLIDEKFREYYDLVLSLDKHIIIEALNEVSEIEGYGVINYPMIKGKQFKQYMPSQTDITAYIIIIDGEPTIITEQYPRSFTKNRFEHSHSKIKRIKRNDKLWNAENLIKYIQEGDSDEKNN